MTALPQDKTGLLRNFLESLPGDTAARLAQAIEIGRLTAGNALPHEEILTGLRPALRRSRRERTPTPQRLFFLPVQDLFADDCGKEKQKGVIARAHAAPIWDWLSRDVMAQEAWGSGREISHLILAKKSEAMVACAQAFHAAASKAICAALDGDPQRKRARAILGGDHILADAQEIALLLAAAPQIARVQAILPAPVPALGEDLVWELRAVYDALVETAPAVAPYVAVIAMNRLARPWEALRLPVNVTRRAQDTLLSKTDMGLVAEILLARMDSQQRAILATRHPLFEAGTLLEEVSNFAQLSSAIVKEIEMRRDGDWGKRLLADRAAVGAAMDAFMERAPREIAAAMPMRKGAGMTADFSRPVDGQKKALALTYARLVAGSRNFAAAASFAARQKDAYEQAGTHLRRYVEDVVRELRAADRERHAIAESQFQFCADLTAILFSEEEAELVRRRGRAAQAA